MVTRQALDLKILGSIPSPAAKISTQLTMLCNNKIFANIDLDLLWQKFVTTLALE